MKKVFLLQVLMFSMVCAFAEHNNQQTEFELKGQLDENEAYSFEASSYIKLLDGFKCNPNTNCFVSLSLFRYGVYPPENGFLGGPPSTGQDGVVGALPGTLNVGDLGGAIYTIPIQLPPGIGDMTPDLAVTYNNQAENGLLGWGWNLSGLSSIERTGKTKYHDGVIGDVKYNTEDRFVLDGKRLMLNNSVPYGGDGATYRTEIDEMSKVVSHTRVYDYGPDCFVVYKADGTIWEYGNSSDSYVYPQNVTGTAASWLVNKISDRDGNTIVFHYDNIYEEGESYINHIEYTLNEKQGVKSMYDVVFCYENRDDVECTYVYENLIQKKRLLKNIVVKDKSSGQELLCYSFDYLKPGYYNDVYYYYNRLHSVGLTADGMKLNPTVITWNNKSEHFNQKFQSHTLNNKIFNKVPFTGDFNGDGFSDVLLVPYKIGNNYSDDVNAEIYINNGDGTFEDHPRCTITFDKTLEWVYVVDFDGDGLSDIVPYYFNFDREYVWKTKAGFYKNDGDVSFSKLGDDLTYDRSFWLHPGDFCGERRMSFYVTYENHSHLSLYLPSIVFYDNGEMKIQTLDKSSYDNVPEDVVVEDVNGDGRHEVIYLMDDYSTVANVICSNGVYSYQHDFTNYEISNQDFLFPGDFNGDGNMDFLRYNIASTWSVVMSDGKKLLPAIRFSNLNLFSGTSLAPQDKYQYSLSQLSAPSVTIRTADFDGDGKCDMGLLKNFGGNFYMNIGTNVYVDKSGGVNFGHVNRYYFNINFGHQYVHVGNFLGQENQSILGTVNSNPGIYEQSKIVALNPLSSMYSVEKITDGLGNDQSFSYDYLMPYKGNELYSLKFKWFDGKMRTTGMPVKALRSNTVYSTNNKPRRNDYSYSDAVYHIDGHGVVGFLKSEIKTFVGNKQTQRKCVEKELKTMGDCCFAMPSSIDIFNSKDKLINSEMFVYEKCYCKDNPKIVIPILTLDRKISYDLGATNDVVKAEITENVYSGYTKGVGYNDVVNLVRTVIGVDKRDCGYDANAYEYRNVTNYDYSNNADAWIVKRLKSMKNSKVFGKEELVGNCEMYEYQDETNPLRVTRKTSTPKANMDLNDPLTIVTTYTYDKVGHIVEQSLTSKSASRKRQTKVEYSSASNYRFPTAFVNENGWRTTASYDDCFGLSCSIVDYNDFEMTTKDDILGITSSSSMPDGVEKVKTKRWASGNKHAPKGAMYYYWEKSTGNAESMVFYHKDGKELRNVTFGLNGEPIYVDMLYDDNGNLSARSYPYVMGENPEFIYFIFDEYNRIVVEIFPNGLRHDYQYGKYDKLMTTTMPDGKMQTKKEVVNAMGWVVEYQDIGGNVMTYDYYSDGLLKSSRIGKNAATIVSYEYDNRRQKSKLVDPSCGVTLYEYDAFGNLTKTVSPKSATTTFEYDSKGDLLSRKMDDGLGGVVATQWVYDNKKGRTGLLKRVMHGDSHFIDYSYDDLLRLVSVNENIQNVDYKTDFEYDAAGRESRKTHPSGDIIETQYSNSGFVRTIFDADDGSLLWKTCETDAWGNVTDYQVGNGLKTHREYDDNLKYLKSIYTSDGNHVFQDLSYTYDYSGNLINRIKKNGGVVSESFEYDDFNRLVGIKLNGKTTGTMVYDELGNMIGKTINDVGVFYDVEFGNDNPYAVRAAKTDVETSEFMSQVIKYNAFDAIATAKNDYVSMMFSYGPDMNRDMMSCIVDGEETMKVYVGDCEYVGGEVFTFLTGPMGVFAVMRHDENNLKSTCYVHKDHLDSWCLITDENCNVVQETSYDAWGNLRDAQTWKGKYNGELLCDRGFTGHEHILALGLINMNGRLYDPMMSMMLSPDNYIQNPYFSQNYNRYRYCYNNPLSYNDPSGELAEWLVEGIFWGFMNVISNYGNIDDFCEGLMLFGAGFIYGCLTHGLGEVGFLTQVLCGTGASVVKVGVNNIVKQNDGSYDWSKIDKNSLKNDVMFAFGSGLASSMLNAYIVYPTEENPGVCLGSLIVEGYKKGHILDTSVSLLAGNLFSNKNPFEGVDFSDLNIDWKTKLPEVLDALSLYFPDSKLIAFLGGLGDVTTLLAGYFNGSNGGGNNGSGGDGGKSDPVMNAIRMDSPLVCRANINAPVCYSGIRSLFLNK